VAHVSLDVRLSPRSPDGRLEDLTANICRQREDDDKPEGE
jgi:hypothetical protein